MGLTTTGGLTFTGGFQIVKATPNYSNLFDGNGDYLTVTGSSIRTTANQNFTIECWVYRNTTGNQMIIGFNTGDYWYITGSTIEASLNGTYDVSASYTLNANTWYHVALSRSSGSCKIFVNGTQVGSTISNTSSFGGDNPTIGTLSTSYYYNGYISNLRFVIGTAVYTSNFTPPTSALTAITNTKLLTCQSATFIDNSTNNYPITPSGNVSVETFNPF